MAREILKYTEHILPDSFHFWLYYLEIEFQTWQPKEASSTRVKWLTENGEQSKDSPQYLTIGHPPNEMFGTYMPEHKCIVSDYKSIVSYLKLNWQTREKAYKSRYVATTGRYMMDK